MKTKIAFFALLAAPFFWSCNNTDETTSSTLTAEEIQEKSATIAVNDMACDKVTDESYYEVAFYTDTEKTLKKLLKYSDYKTVSMKGHSGTRYVDGDGPEITVDSTDGGYPVTITIDYGDTTELKNGTIISGVIEIVISAAKNTDGATRTTTYSGFVIDSVSVEGSFAELFNGSDSTRMKTKTSTLTFSFPDSTVIERTSENIHEWLSGVSTSLDYSDDTIQVTGNMEAVSSDGDDYTRVITTPLIKVGDCHYYVSGVVTYSLNGVVVATLDYGDGTCDNSATLTSGDTVTDITLSDHSSKPKTSGHHKKH